MGTSGRRKRRAGEPVDEDASQSGQSRLSELADERAPDQSRVDQYSQWASRLRDKRVQSKEKIAQADGSGPAAAQPSYWQADDVYRESRRIEQEASRKAPATSDIAAAFAFLDLPTSADIDEIEARYRELAKLHHPDRHQADDDETRAHHAQLFRSVNDARQVLRSLT